MIVDCALYDDGVRRPVDLHPGEIGRDHLRPGSFLWIGLHEPEEHEFEGLAEELGLHPLVVEDAVHAHQRPKLERYDDTILLVLRTADWDRSTERLVFAELQLIAGPGFVVSIRHGSASALSSVRANLEADPDTLRHGPVAVLHAVCDKVVDDYVPVVGDLEDAVQDVEGRVFSTDRGNPGERIYRLKREVLAMYRAVEPLHEAIDPMVKGTVPHADSEFGEYFRDIDDHLHRVLGRIDVLREMLSDALAANLAEISVRQNNDMRTISAWAAVIAVPTMLAGIWGMNFDRMPELEWEIGYALALTIIAGSAWAVHRRMKRSGWL